MWFDWCVTDRSHYVCITSQFFTATSMTWPPMFAGSTSQKAFVPNKLPEECNSHNFPKCKFPGMLISGKNNEMDTFSKLPQCELNMKPLL